MAEPFILVPNRVTAGSLFTLTVGLPINWKLANGVSDDDVWRAGLYMQPCSRRIEGDGSWEPFERCQKCKGKKKFLEIQVSGRGAFGPVSCADRIDRYTFDLCRCSCSSSRLHLRDTDGKRSELALIMQLGSHVVVSNTFSTTAKESRAKHSIRFSHSQAGAAAAALGQPSSSTGLPRSTSCTTLFPEPAAPAPALSVLPPPQCQSAGAAVTTPRTSLAPNPSAPVMVNTTAGWSTPGHGARKPEVPQQASSAPTVGLLAELTAQSSGFTISSGIGLGGMGVGAAGAANAGYGCSSEEDDLSSDMASSDASDLSSDYSSSSPFGTPIGEELMWLENGTAAGSSAASATIKIEDQRMQDRLQQEFEGMCSISPPAACVQQTPLTTPALQVQPSMLQQQQSQQQQQQPQVLPQTLQPQQLQQQAQQGQTDQMQQLAQLAAAQARQEVSQAQARGEACIVCACASSVAEEQLRELEAALRRIVREQVTGTDASTCSCSLVLAGAAVAGSSILLLVTRSATVAQCVAAHSLAVLYLTNTMPGTTNTLGCDFFDPSRTSLLNVSQSW